MSKFRKKSAAGQPAISTASLPDIVFMLLFFFMVVTVIRQNELKVEISVPAATQLEKIENKSLTNYIYIGKPLKQFRKQYGDAPKLQLNDKFARIEEIPAFVAEKRDKAPERMRKKIVTSLRVDRDVTMGIVSDVKTELRKVGQLKINYAAMAGDIGGN